MEMVLPQVHFRRQKEISATAAQSIAQMILLADKAWKRGPESPEVSE